MPCDLGKAFDLWEPWLSYLYAGRDDGDLPWGVVRIERGETHKALSTMPGTHSVFTKRELLSFGLEFREDWSVSVV